MKTLKKISIMFAALWMVVSSFQATASANTQATVDDTVITTKIKAKMVADKITSARGINVETNNGVVFLTGNVESESEASEAIELSASTEGVVDVDATNLTVKMSNHPIADSMITAKVKGAFLREKLFGEKPIAVMSIHAETKGGVVYLKGTADTKLQAETAERLAKSVKGVKKVESSITIK